MYCRMGLDPKIKHVEVGGGGGGKGGKEVGLNFLFPIDFFSLCKLFPWKMQFSSKGFSRINK